MADSARHPDVVDLAEYAEGILDTSRRQSVEGHVRDCADCSAVLAELAGLTQTLAQAPISPMPDDVAARLDRVVAAEATARASTWSGTAKVTPIRRTRRWLAPLASAAAVIAAIAIAVPALDTSDDSAQDESSGDSTSESFDSGSQAPTALDPNSEPVALTTEHFGRDVIDAYYSGSDAVRVAVRLESALIDEDVYREATESVPGLCDLSDGSSVPRGEVDAITFDGDPAQLLRRDQGHAVDVIAFVCDDKGPQILDAVTLRLR
ncbi:MAG TPA: hypothetical protein VEX15_04135 [Nocardioidaceae bacterium]|nr:hypothetical protein [Nocardioidaceae bacterium]